VADLDAQISDAVLLLEAGTWPELDGSARAAKVVAALDGRPTLRVLSALCEAVVLYVERRELGAFSLMGFGKT
jgi:hypothetical protein